MHSYVSFGRHTHYVANLFLFTPDGHDCNVYLNLPETTHDPDMQNPQEIWVSVGCNGWNDQSCTSLYLCFGGLAFINWIISNTSKYKDACEAKQTGNLWSSSCSTNGGEGRCMNFKGIFHDEGKKLKKEEKER
jgi:hypothetical protein